MRLLRAVEEGLIRPHDEVISVIRDPLEIVISHVNYIITRILQDQESGTFAPDTKGWLGQLGVAELPSEMSPATVVQTWKSLLYNPEIVTRNTICPHWLGNGDVRSFLNRVVINDVERSLDTPRYSAWLCERWGIQREARANESVHYVTRDMIDASDMDHIGSLIAEDRKVYAMVSEAITQSGRTSIRGSEPPRASTASSEEAVAASTCASRLTAVAASVPCFEQRHGAVIWCVHACGHVAIPRRGKQRQQVPRFIHASRITSTRSRARRSKVGPPTTPNVIGRLKYRSMLTAEESRGLLR